MNNQGGYLIRRQDLLFPELSFKISGILFEVSRQLGGGHQEKYYQKALSQALFKNSVPFKEQVCVPITFDGKTIGKYYLDFLVNDQIVVELKRGEFISNLIITQTKQYLSALKLQLGLLACFTHSGVVIKRIINQY